MSLVLAQGYLHWPIMFDGERVRAFTAMDHFVLNVPSARTIC